MCFSSFLINYITFFFQFKLLPNPCHFHLFSPYSFFLIVNIILLMEKAISLSKEEYNVLQDNIKIKAEELEKISLTNLMNQHSLQCNKVFEALQLFISTHPAHMAPCCLHLFLVFPTTHFFTNPYSSIHPCIHSKNTFWDTCACWGLCWDPGVQQEIRHCTQGLASTSGQRAHWMTVKKIWAAEEKGSPFLQHFM